MDGSDHWGREQVWLPDACASGQGGPGDLHTDKSVMSGEGWLGETDTVTL